MKKGMIKKDVVEIKKSSSVNIGVVLNKIKEGIEMVKNKIDGPAAVDVESVTDSVDVGVKLGEEPVKQAEEQGGSVEEAVVDPVVKVGIGEFSKYSVAFNPQDFGVVRSDSTVANLLFAIFCELRGLRKDLKSKGK